MKRRVFIQQIGAGVALMGPGPAFARDSDMPNYKMPEEFLPREVRISNKLAPYEIHVDPGQHALYWTLPDRKAIRYAVGIGRPGLYEAGEFYVGAKKEWPSWTPTPDMIKREPGKYAKYKDGLPGGLNNPLGRGGCTCSNLGSGIHICVCMERTCPKRLGGVYPMAVRV